MAEKKKTTNPIIKTLRETEDKFLRINKRRLLRVFASVDSKQHDFITILPLLFHTNEQRAAGYVSQDPPVGVSGYTPDDRTMEVAQGLFSGFPYPRGRIEQPAIHSIFLMGSTGTIAQSSRSDFDVWLCHDPALDDEQRKKLALKASLIEKWAEKLCDMEVHFFLMDADAFRSGSDLALTSESSGTTQHYLLLDEFYRTSLLAAGRHPAWWLVPPEKEGQYDEYLAKLFGSKAVKSTDYIDFGGVPKVPAEEFFGAALWHVNKGIDSPYKSILKLLLMESYASDYPKVDLLCARFKQAIYEGDPDPSDIDPYILLLRKLEQYLGQEQDGSRLDFLRRAFYLKINLKMSAPAKANEVEWRRNYMEQIIADWQWDNVKVSSMDKQEQWGVSRIREERKSVVTLLSQSYLFLSNFARKNSDIYAISQKDLNTLGRKLYAAFERKAGKIEIFNRGFVSNDNHAHLSIFQTLKSNKTEQWVLYQGQTSYTSAKEEEPLKRSHSVIELIAWSYFNNLLTDHSTTTLYCPNSPFSMRDLRLTHDYLQENFPLNKFYAEDEKLGAATKVTNLVAFLNVGYESGYSETSKTMHMGSDIEDPFNYGALRKNLLSSIDLVLKTNWNEVFSFRFTGNNAVLEAIRQLLTWHTSKGAVFPEFKVYCYSNSYKRILEEHVPVTLNKLLNTFLQAENKGGADNYILEIDGDPVLVHCASQKVSYSTHTSSASLYNALSSPSNQFSSARFDENVRGLDLLKQLYELNRKDVIQLLARKKRNEVEVFILDEHGSLFYKVEQVEAVDALVNHYALFLDSIKQRLEFTLSSDQLVKKDVELRKIMGMKKGELVLEEIDYAFMPGMLSFYNVQVMLDEVDGEKNYSILCEDKEFSSLDSGAQLFQDVAQHIMGQRKGKERNYPIYITDMDISPALLDVSSPEKIQTIHYLMQKRAIEDELNQASRAL